MRGRARPRPLLVAVVAFPLLAAAAHAAPLVPPGARGGFTVALYGGLTGLYLIALAGARPGGGTRAILLAGLLARIALLGAPSFNSHDVERYLWDGAVLLEGKDPYRAVPDDPALDPLRGKFPPPHDNRTVPTIYPPLALALFAGAAAAGPAAALFVWKAIVAASSIAALLALDRLLDGEEKARRLAHLSFSPLVVLEGGIGAHLDLLALPGLVLGLLALRRGSSGGAGIAFGFAASIKLLPLVILLPVAGWLRRDRRARFLAGAGAALALPYLLAFAAGLRPPGSLRHFLERWEFGSPLHAAALAVGLPARETRWALGLLALLLLVALAMRARSRPAAAVVRDGFAAALLLSPVVFPWYLAILVPALAVSPSLPLLTWTLLHPLTYEVVGRYETTGAWSPAAWPLWVVVAGVGAAFGIDRARGSRGA